jgi:hypothetical protein
MHEIRNRRKQNKENKQQSNDKIQIKQKIEKTQ